MRMVDLTAPYVPGYLAFREAEILVQLIEKQKKTRPELTPQVRSRDDKINQLCYTYVRAQWVPDTDPDTDSKDLTQSRARFQSLDCPERQSPRWLIN